MKLKIVLFILTLSSLTVFGQQELTLYNMNSISQSVRVNPSQLPTTRFYIGLPVISSTSVLLSNSFVFHDFYKKRSDDSVVIDIDNTIEQLSKNNLLSLSLSTDLLSFGVMYRNNFISFNMTEKANINFSYAKDLLNLIDKGNGPFIGQTLDFSKTGFDATHYREYGIGVASKVSDRLNLGVRMKYLYGMENFSSVTNNLSLYTASDDYGLVIPVDVTVNSSTQANSTNGYNGMSISDYLFKKKNRGYAIDLGATYRLNQKFTLSASLLDYGSITWNSDVKNYRASAGEYTFDGIDIKQMFSDSSGSQNALDSLSSSFKLTKTEKSYSTKLPAHSFLGLNYNLNPNFYIGALVQTGFIKKTVQPTATLSLNKKFGRHLALSVDYSYINHHFNNLGTGFSVIAGPVQLYAISDNLLGILHPLDYNTAHMHFGINLVFGRKPLKGSSNLNFSRGHKELSYDTKNSKKESKAKDTDGDGVPDAIDFCPNVPGLAKFDGCPDTDGDGIQDMFDNCPTEPGEPGNNGCPKGK